MAREAQHDQHSAQPEVPNVGKDTADPARKAKSECLRLLAVQPRTSAELRKALTRKGFDAAVADQVLGKLERARLVNDEEYAEMWVRSRHANQGLGRRALTSELVRRGVDRETAEQAAESIDVSDEEVRARDLVRKRLPTLRHVDESTAVRRLVAMLARKGYAEGLAYRVVREELAEDGRETTLLDETQTSL